MVGRDYWLSIAELSTPDDLREHILTGFKSGKPFTPYVPTIELPAPLDRVLDFGCGVGRSFPFLKSIARRVTGFDLPPMIERCRTLAPVPADELLDHWPDARGRQFDLIVCVLVLQHLEPAACRSFLEDFARMAPAVYLLTRAETYVTFAQHRGWTVERYAAWLRRSLRTAVDGPPAAANGGRVPPAPKLGTM